MNSRDIADGLRQLGLTTGDIVLLHSSLASLGPVEGGAEAVLEAFLSVLGETGTLLVPAFEPGLGLISDAVARHPRAVLSVHPLASVAAIGPQAQALCQDHWQAETAHGPGSPYHRVAQRGGYVCLLGVDQDRNTTLHTAEAQLRLPYLAAETRTFATPQGETTRSWPFFPGPHRDFIRLDPLLRASGKMRLLLIGQAVARLIKSRDLIELAVQAGNHDPAFVLCDNPNCPDCLGQRARLRQAAFAAEKFTVVASALLAGEFPDDIAARCREAGIAAIELDGLRRRPLPMLGREVITDAVHRLRQQAIQVAALRLPAVSTKALDLIRLAAELKINRVVMPLAHQAPVFSQAGAEARVEVSFYNTDLDSDACSEVLLRLRDQQLPARFTFNGANFARLGELPFLVSYKKKLRRFVDQLDVTDGTYDGRPQPLAQGNGELKEMISILRCASFNGRLSLSATNAATGGLKAAAERLGRLLQAL